MAGDWEGVVLAATRAAAKALDSSTSYASASTNTISMGNTPRGRNVQGGLHFQSGVEPRDGDIVPEGCAGGDQGAGAQADSRGGGEYRRDSRAVGQTGGGAGQLPTVHAAEIDPTNHNAIPGTFTLVGKQKYLFLLDK
mmetsp:Transcript_49934/g.97713  ORF Transcript_49934/g.97713 Transcript_49934/m.97713 type:complete len:138 (-) Transcript_49934:441-854(-)